MSHYEIIEKVFSTDPPRPKHTVRLIKRSGRRGLALPSILVAAMLLSSLALLTSSSVVTSLSTVISLNKKIENSAIEYSLGNFSRPLLIASFSESSRSDHIQLNGNAIVGQYGGLLYSVSAQDIDGLIDIDLTSIDAIKDTISPDIQEIIFRIRSFTPRESPLFERYVKAGGSPDKFIRFETQVTTRGSDHYLNSSTLYTGYDKKTPFRRNHQMKEIRIDIETR